MGYFKDYVLTPRLKIFMLVTPVLFVLQPICYGIERTDKEFLRQFIQGTYSVVGKRPGSNKTYHGAVKITQNNNGFAIVRCVQEKRLTGSAEIVEITADKILNLKYSFKEGKNVYEGRYDIHSDIENYGRLSGPYMKKGSKSKLGWEMLYIDGDSPQECNRSDTTVS
jgi:hypothetical protein